ncbi:MAG: hypothetical protein KIH63_000505 [Candidatus Saccharibacteria bacterium]|nr:hypothetical protein [Candidatus Saccharibacteria bacterium]
MKLKHVAASAAAILPLAACGGEAEPVQQDGAVVTRLEWVSFAHVERTTTYTEFGYCDPEVLFPDDENDSSYRDAQCTVPIGAYAIQLAEAGEGDTYMWQYNIDELEVFDDCAKNSRDLKVHDTDQATDRVPVEFCSDFAGAQELPGAKIVYDAVNYYINFSHTDGDIFVGASRSQWQNIPVGGPLEIVITANNDLVCYAPLGSGECLYD